MTKEMEEAIKTGTLRVHQLRKERFQGILAEYEAEGPDSSVPGCSKFGNRQYPDLWAHYALVVQGDGGRFFVLCCEGRQDVEYVAALQVQDGWTPICYYDLDELAGPEPGVAEGDIVEYDDGTDEHGRYHVIRTEDDHSEGEMFQWVHIDKNPDVEWLDGADLRVDDSEVTVVERADPDERNPVRYQVAGVRTLVVFNTEAAPA